MKEAKFLKIDYTIQIIVGVLMLVFLPFLYGLILLLPFGIWQVVSSLIMVYGYKDQKRIPHLVFTVAWFVIAMITQDFLSDSFPVSFLYVIILPACVGIWYFVQTKKDFKLMEAKEAAMNEYV